MNIAFCSIFSSATWYLDRFFQQIVSFRDAIPQHNLHLCLVEGDSEDDTLGQLYRHVAIHNLNATIAQHNHGHKVFRSVESAERFANLAGVGNRALSLISSTDDIVCYCESDLWWTPETMVQLVQHGVDAVVPMVWYKQQGIQFYDTWAYARSGKRFSPFFPFHECLAGDEQLVELDSAGSCMVMKSKLARTVQFSPVDCFVGLSRNLKQLGAHIYLDKTANILHPKRPYDP